jgi:hypothetical protein
MNENLLTSRTHSLFTSPGTSFHLKDDRQTLLLFIFTVKEEEGGGGRVFVLIDHDHVQRLTAWMSGPMKDGLLEPPPITNSSD